MLIAVVLLGTIVGTTLTAMTTTVRSTAWERDRATAQMWLQSAIEVLDETAALDCNENGATEATLRAEYEATIRTSVTPPPGWSSDQLRIVEPVQFWDPGLEFQASCYDDFGFDLQLIELEVASPDGTVIERVQSVIGSE